MVQERIQQFNQENAPFYLVDHAGKFFFPYAENTAFGSFGHFSDGGTLGDQHKPQVAPVAGM